MLTSNSFNQSLSPLQALLALYSMYPERWRETDKFNVSATYSNSSNRDSNDIVTCNSYFLTVPSSANERDIVTESSLSLFHLLLGSTSSHKISLSVKSNLVMTVLYEIQSSPGMIGKCLSPLVNARNLVSWCW